MTSQGVFIIVVASILPFLAAGMVAFAKAQQGYDFQDMLWNVIGCFVCVGFFSGTVVFVVWTGGEIPPLGPKPEGGCSTIEKLWQEDGRHYAGVRYPSGNVKSLLIDRDDYAALKVGDRAEVDWSTAEVSTFMHDGAIWGYTVKAGCSGAAG